MADLFVVTGVGMHTPVGTSAAQSAASLRAGISRIGSWPYYGHAGDPVVVGAVAADGKDASWVEKAIPILTPAVYEALWQAGLYEYTYHQRRVGLFIATPPPTRTGVHPDLFTEFTEILGDLWAVLAGNDDIYPVARAQVGGAVALAEACGALSRGQLDAAVIAGVESHLDSAYLDELLAADRLHTSDRSGGIIPGEGGGVFVLETAEAARRRKAPVLARVSRLALEQEPEGWTPRRPSQGTALARALQAVLASDPEVYHRLIVDHNGERWRFREWALAEPRALASLPPRWALWHPADSVGDTGAAFIPFAVGWATQAFARKYAGPGGILIAAMNDTGERAALTLLPP